MDTQNTQKPGQPPVLTRIRVTFSKSGPLIYTGALDLQKIWERVLRRARLKVAYTQGFNPGPRVNLASAMPLGVNGAEELADFWFNETPDLQSFCERVNQSAPAGLRALRAEEVPLSTPALQTRVEAAEYRLDLPASINLDEIRRKVETLMAAKSLPRERRGKPYDLRPLIYAMSVIVDENGRAALTMTLQAREGATGRADEVQAALELEPGSVQLTRVKLLLKPDSHVVKYTNLSP